MTTTLPTRVLPPYDARPFNMSSEDAYSSSNHEPLTPQAGRPIDTKDSVARINKMVYDGLRNQHEKNETDAYFQSHPFDYMYTSQSLAIDSATLSNNYMRAVFGGNIDEKKDNIHMAYNHATMQNAEAPTGKVLYSFKPEDFIEGEQATKDSLLKTFAESRRHYNGQLVSDAEAFMRARSGHELTQVVYYGKNISEAGQAGRFHHLAGQHGHLMDRPNTEGLLSWSNISSRTFAPDGLGGEVPLMIQASTGPDPRTVPLPSDLPSAVPDAPRTFNFNDTGSYAGRDIDRFQTAHVETGGGFLTGMFAEPGQRRWS